jgi:hypothetical protein
MRFVYRLTVLTLFILTTTTAYQAKITVGTLSVEREATRGEHYSGGIVISNDDNVPAEAILYQRDYLFSSDGSNRYGEPGKQPRSNASWVAVNPHTVEIPPKSSTTVAYSVNVPDQDSLMGTYWSMIMVEEQTENKSTPPNDDTKTLVRQVIRYGVQCVTHIRDTGKPQVQFTGSRLVKTDPTQNELQVDVENTGARWIVPVPHVELYDMNGYAKGRFECAKKRIYPGTSVRFQINLGVTPAGKYKALVVLDSGEQQLYGAKYDLEF